MRRLCAVIAVLTLTIVGAPHAWGGGSMDNRIAQGAPGALEGGFQQGGGKLAFLALASPRFCNDGSNATNCPNAVHIWFYNATCSRVNDVAQPLKQNQAVFLSLAGVTPVTAGNYLVATAKPDPSIPRLQRAHSTHLNPPIIGNLLFVDVNRGIGRMEYPAQMGDRTRSWSSYRTSAALLFSPGDDGVTFTSELILRCPTGVQVIGGEDFSATRNKVRGTQGFLGGDMLELSSQAVEPPNVVGQGYTFFSTMEQDWLFYSMFSPFVENGLFATAVNAVVYDLNGNILTTATTPCQCFTLGRLSAVAPVAAATPTYWELFSVPGQPNADGGTFGMFAGNVNIQAKILGGNFNFWTPLFSSTVTGNLIGNQ